MGWLDLNRDVLGHYSKQFDDSWKFSCYIDLQINYRTTKLYNPYCNFLRFGNSTLDFLRVNFCSRDFCGFYWIFLNFDFCPYSIVAVTQAILGGNVLQETTNNICLFYRSHLVPVFGFGQNDVFSRQPKISFLQSYQTGRSKWEKWGKIFIKGCLLAPFARFCIMPDPRPITVVGEFSKIFTHS